MPTFALRSVPATKPVAGLIAHGPQVALLARKFADRTGLMVVMGDDWLAAIVNDADASLPWLAEPPTYLYEVTPGLLCQTGLAPDIPAPLLPALATRLGPSALTDGPRHWDFTAARPLATADLRSLL